MIIMSENPNVDIVVGSISAMFVNHAGTVEDLILITNVIKREVAQVLVKPSIDTGRKYS